MKNRTTETEALKAAYRRSLPELAADWAIVQKLAAQNIEKIEKFKAALDLKAELLCAESSSPLQATKRTPKGSGEYDTKTLIIESGYYTAEEAEEGPAKGAIKEIEKYKDQLSAEELKGVLEKISRYIANGLQIKTKCGYLTGAIQHFITEHGGTL